MKTIYIFLLITLVNNALHAQQVTPLAPFQRWTLATNASYFWDTQADFPEYFYQDWTISVSLATDISHRFRLGLERRFIYSYSRLSQATNQYNIDGFFLQCNILPPENRVRFFLELAVRSGNYCNCSDGDPYKKTGILYGGYGAGLQFNIWRGLFANVYFSGNAILNDIEGKYAYNNFFTGLHYTFNFASK
ncbi:MAG: hypothetical protein ACK4TA_18470 [Saprospiraceae bacterium]